MVTTRSAQKPTQRATRSSPRTASHTEQRAWSPATTRLIDDALRLIVAVSVALVVARLQGALIALPAPWVNRAVVFGRASWTANAMWKKAGGTAPETKRLHHFVTMVVAGYGGGCLCPILLGDGGAPAPLTNDTIPAMSLLAWVLFFRTSFFGWLYNLRPVKLCAIVLESMFKAGLIVKMSAKAHAALGSLAGPLVIGTVAGCGGAFTSSADLSALAALPSGVVEAFWASVFVNLGAWPSTYLATLGVSTPAFLGELSERTIQTALTASLAGLAAHRELGLVRLVSRQRDGPSQ